MPTLASVEAKIKDYETRYGITTNDFVKMEGQVPEVDREDAVEWLYLVEQGRVLREAAAVSLYSFRHKTGPLTSEPCSPEKLADRLAA